MPHREKARKFLAENGHGEDLRHVNVRSVNQKSGEKSVMQGDVGRVPAGVTMTPEGLARGGIAGKRTHKPRKPAGRGLPAVPVAPPQAPPAAPMEPDGDEAAMAGAGGSPPGAGAPPGAPPFKRGGRC